MLFTLCQSWQDSLQPCAAGLECCYHELHIKCGHSQTEENWPQHTTTTQILCRKENFGISFYYLGVSSTRNSDTSLTVVTGVVLGRFNRTAQVPLARQILRKNLRYLLWYILINRILNSHTKGSLRSCDSVEGRAGPRHTTEPFG